MVIARYYEPGWKRNRRTYADTAIGGREVASTVTVATDGRMRPLSGQQRLSADKQTLYASHRFYCPVFDVVQGDELESPGGVGYRVVFVKDVMSMDRHLEVDCELVGHD